MAIAFRRIGGTRGGVLLVHGFTGTPHEMEGLADPLAAAGFGVLGVRLPGHGDRLPGEPNDWPAWEAAVEEGFAALRELTPAAPRAVVGLSMGALLALELARQNRDDVRAVVTLSPAVLVPQPKRAVLWLAARTLGERGRQRLLPRGMSDIRDPEVRAVHPRSQPFTIAAALSFNQLRLAVRGRVGAVEQPLLIVHSVRDRTCPVVGARWLARNVGSRDVELCTLEQSGHVIPVDLERTRATELILAFLDRTLAPRAVAGVTPPIEAVQAAVHESSSDR
jgi:carboxylesterase